MTSNVRRWVTAVGFTGGAVVAVAMIGATGTPAARADDGSLPPDIGLLNAAEADVTDAFNLWSQVSGGATLPEDPDAFNLLESIETPLLSSDNSFASGLGDSLFTGPDQQLAQASEAFLSAVDTYAENPSVTNELDVLSASFQVDDSLLFNILPAEVAGKLIDQLFDLGGFDTTSASAAADVATSASSAAATPDEVIGQAISDLNQGTAVLDAAPTADLSARQADILTEQESVATQLDPLLTQEAALQEGLPAGDQTFLANADEQFVTAAQNLLSADQAFVAADQAGDLTGSSLNATDLTVLLGDAGLVSADFNTLGDTLLAIVFPDIGSLLP
jgi:hypothetical protein